MAEGKAVNRKGFYGASEVGQAPDIAMPPINETPAVQMAAPKMWEDENIPSGPMAAVPKEVPGYVIQEMQEYSQEEAAAEEVNNINETSQIQDHSKPDTSAAANLRALREAKERAEREREEMFRLMMQMQQQNQPKAQEYVEPEPEDDLSIEDDALAEGKHVRHVNKAVREQQKQIRELQKQLQSYQAQSSESIIEAKLKAKYSDFDDVVSLKNIETLRDEYPELALMISSTPDLYAKGASAYSIIKQYGIHKDPVIDRNREVALRNMAKPRPLSSVNPQQGDSPLSKANAFANGEFTQEMKEQLRREMMQARKAR